MATTKTILIVDDVPFVRKTIGEILTQAHYQIIGEAADGQEAVALFQKLRPDLVTMDVVMPKMSGIEATKMICKMDPKAVILMVTGMGQESLVMEAINAGARDYIQKPFSSTDILRAVERALLDESQILERQTKAHSHDSDL